MGQEHENDLVQIQKKLQEGVLPAHGKHAARIMKKLNKWLRDGIVYTMKQIEEKIKLLKELYMNFS